MYISLDIEADGPVPGLYSMLSLGAVAFQHGKEVDEFYSVLKPLPEAQQHPDTMKFWRDNPEAWAAVNTCQVDAAKVMLSFHDWLINLHRQYGGGLTPVGYPAAFDYMFINWYMVNFLGKNIMGFSAFDLKSFATGLLDKPYRKTVKRTMPKDWFKDLPPHTHIAVDDAREQGLLLMNMLKFKEERNAQA
jgi:DNA polymerase III alpha subunit (gram-positive type)